MCVSIPPHSGNICVSSDYPKPSLIFILAFFKANLVLFGESAACSFTYTQPCSITVVWNGICLPPNWAGVFPRRVVFFNAVLQFHSVWTCVLTLIFTSTSGEEIGHLWSSLRWNNNPIAHRPSPTANLSHNPLSPSLFANGWHFIARSKSGCVSVFLLAMSWSIVNYLDW